MAKKGLGRGIESIFIDNTITEEQSSTDRQTVSITLIDTNPDQPRKNFDMDSIASLAESIAANGLLQPILVRPVDERYEIIAGERRFRACKLAELTEVPVIVLKADDVSTAKFAIIENIQREDLNPYEEAAAYRTLMDQYGFTQEEVSAQLGKSRSAIANALRLLDLPEELVRLLIDGKLSAGHSRTLLGLKNREDMLPLAEKIIEKSLSVREVENQVKRLNREYLASQQGEPEEDETPRVDYFKVLENRFTNVTGRQCKITETRNRRSFTVEYRDNEDLEEILKLLGGKDVLENY